MADRLRARELFEELGERLALRWVAGQRGGERVLERGEHLSRRPSLAGYLNVIHPNKVQIVGSAELAWLDGLDARTRWEVLQKITESRPLAMVITQDQSCPADLRDAAEETDTPVWVSPRRGYELLNLLQYHLARALAPRVTLHGVFMEIYSIGVLVTGDSGAGKSELALELISRGHRLVADDAPEFTQIAPDVLDGTCPELLQDLLEVRGLGVLNIREMFGDTAVKRNKYLRLIVHLEQTAATGGDAMARITGESGSRQVLDLDVPVVALPVAAGRNLAVLTEAAVRLHLLRSKGIDPAAAFLARHSAFLQQGGTDVTDPARPLLYVVTGMSGSGKSVALKTLEDLDIYCTDNLPVELLPQFVRSVAGEDNPRLAVGIDVRNASDLERIPEWLSAVGELGVDHQLVFLDTRDDVLLKRYSDTRRKHPLSHEGLALADAIELERVRLRPLRAIADLVMDTSEMNVHQMRRQVITALGVGASQGMSLLFESFAYKRGLPADADFVFDARALPNPHWDARLRPLSGRDPAVREHLDGDPVVQAFVAQVTAFVDAWVPRFEAETRSYLTIAFGCTGGRHRSVYLAERLAAHCRGLGRDGVLTFHRELE